MTTTPRSGAPLPAHVPRILALAGQGLTTRQIAARLGVHQSTAARWIRATRLSAPAGRRRTRVSDEDLLTMRAQGWSHRQIAAEIGMSKGGVEARLTAALARRESPATPAGDVELVAARRAGASWRELAFLAGGSSSSVRLRVLRAQQRRS